MTFAEKLSSYSDCGLNRIGFIYFRFKPVNWQELDTLQKFKYGITTKLKGDQYAEWVKIFHKVRSQYFS